MIWETSMLNAKPSRERTVIEDSFASKLCASVRFAQFNTIHRQHLAGQPVRVSRP
jgi:hypothetical protein